jgi:hypothetical protein
MSENDVFEKWAKEKYLQICVYIKIFELQWEYLL